MQDRQYPDLKNRLITRTKKKAAKTGGPFLHIFFYTSAFPSASALYLSNSPQNLIIGRGL